MTDIILVRHGETEWNVGKIFRGRKDIPLNEMGRKQAELLGKYLSEVRVDAIYSSPLKRALDTANLIAKYQPEKIDVQVTEGLLDINYGEWEGRSEQEVNELYPELYELWNKSPHEVLIPKGESLAAVRERALSAVNEIVSKYKGNVALVSHRVVNKVLTCALLGLDNSHFWNIRQDVGGVTIFSYEDNRFILTKHNDTSYLKEIQKYVLGDF
ncbi:MAG: histidine phosphatase family protein [Candidatus Aenigmarchaeota archaeon]|nr:histidine phosphatase family protein [Candidatus Aenigmarchaeota archaeon]